jgi:hypothetical protein
MFEIKNVTFTSVCYSWGQWQFVALMVGLGLGLVYNWSEGLTRAFLSTQPVNDLCLKYIAGLNFLV